MGLPLVNPLVQKQSRWRSARPRHGRSGPAPAIGAGGRCHVGRRQARPALIRDSSGAPICRRRPSSLQDDGEGAGPEKGSLKETLLLCIPSFFDLVATVLMNVGLLSVTASVYQMMRGAEMLFAAIFVVAFLGRRLNKYHYLGIGCCAVRGERPRLLGARGADRG